MSLNFNVFKEEGRHLFFLPRLNLKPWTKTLIYVFYVIAILFSLLGWYESAESSGVFGVDQA